MVTRSVKKLQRSWKTFTTKSVKETSKIKEDLCNTYKRSFSRNLLKSSGYLVKNPQRLLKIVTRSVKKLQRPWKTVSSRSVRESWKINEDLCKIRKWSLDSQVEDPEGSWERSYKQPCRDLSQDPPQRPFQMLKRLSLWSPSGLSCSKVG